MFGELCHGIKLIAENLSDFPLSKLNVDLLSPLLKLELDVFLVGRVLNLVTHDTYEQPLDSLLVSKYLVC